MAKLEKKLKGDFDSILTSIEDGILDGSISATLEDKSDFKKGNSRCSVRVFERYSWFGGNRLSLSVTLFQSDDEIKLSAISSGGSTALIMKVNTVGENAFLDKLKEVLEGIK